MLGITTHYCSKHYCVIYLTKISLKSTLQTQNDCQIDLQRVRIPYIQYVETSHTTMLFHIMESFVSHWFETLLQQPLLCGGPWHLEVSVGERQLYSLGRGILWRDGERVQVADLREAVLNVMNVQLNAVLQNTTTQQHTRRE